MPSHVLGGNTFQLRGEAAAAERGLTLEQYVCAVVEETGSLSAAAHRLNVNRNTVRYYLRKAGKRAVAGYIVRLDDIDE